MAEELAKKIEWLTFMRLRATGNDRGIVLVELSRGLDPTGRLRSDRQCPNASKSFVPEKLGVRQGGSFREGLFSRRLAL